MNVSAIIVTRGDVDLAPVVDSLPHDWEKVIWNNGDGHVARWSGPPDRGVGFCVSIVTDLAVYGRYAAITYASHDLIYVADDDVIVSDPQAIVQAWRVGAWNGMPRYLVANMPSEFRHDGYTDSCLVGFGSCFHRDLPARAFSRFDPTNQRVTSEMFERTCDVVFTTLTPRVLVDVPITHREFASDPDRMWKQPGHVAERTRMLELARAVRDA